jgi:hypothetical protein
MITATITPPSRPRSRPLISTANTSTDSTNNHNHSAIGGHHHHLPAADRAAARRSAGIALTTAFVNAETDFTDSRQSPLSLSPMQATTWATSWALAMAWAATVVPNEDSPPNDDLRPG